MNVENILVSVVVPTYNRETLIKNTIDSVLNQTHENFELIIVDDASTDNTVEIIKGYEDSRIKFIKLDKNSQGTKPRNIGIQESQGQYIALLDSDDEWLPTKLERQLKFLQQFNDEKMVCFTDLKLKEAKKIRYSNNNEFVDGTNILEYILIDKNWVQTSTYMFSSKLGKETLFNPTLKKHQDWDFCLRLSNNGANFVNLPEPLTTYYLDERDGRIGNNNKYLQSLKWLASVEDSISEKAKHAFLVQVVTKPLIFDKQRKKAFQIYLKAWKNNVLNISELFKGIIKCITPLFLYRSIIKFKG
ncbi:glycosyltransferase family 2 protein [Bacillus cereus group sp. MYBK245-2]|uniref:Putative teichuronic acid biosynthesis glycosyltransferase TuaG n=1 Tax=Bacillus pacificus TaxID=2026187 RepID=A0A1Y5Z1I4_9BACI|nr:MULTISPECIES: glycosyltransferase family 2 protein [Bacteria]MCZ7522057.1 glycosyltransferase family 2 protein [Bacillus pacificus]MDA1573908.1 glycosyltransferase family 2 protein [Bacillus cereus group sp. TH242-3LC]MDQ4681583.1 glycosyltransferase family 2 protein [Stenotrophomonas maltophilia group sp. RNC7]MED1586512.1 glycosyltransferase family 2 protein [Bacillus pacificus]UTG89243.1 glycosyltransferase family 2 protein [Bacillus pacificus]